MTTLNAYACPHCAAAYYIADNPCRCGAALSPTGYSPYGRWPAAGIRATAIIGQPIRTRASRRVQRREHNWRLVAVAIVVVAMLIFAFLIIDNQMRNYGQGNQNGLRTGFISAPVMVATFPVNVTSLIGSDNSEFHSLVPCNRVGRCEIVQIIYKNAKVEPPLRVQNNNYIRLCLEWRN